ncbi:ead/Ea22-like family protein [Klebsiella pneumoniae]|uniref:Ead/Ea22-like family protein n=1 Tax=Klebsiella pneumoniae TaxID=573 RepID=A0A6G4TSL2_KLEPN|nr:ead/Ea22-like family protein [Klebsiella pneumoniae]MBM6457206.1 ead/Ea22-like family protein [Klebsiella pneumoniae]MBM9449713.1 ead/Ea22-like family protein [Klebsiella pneumoniae]MCS7336235.1 ead/Ea22-like family protein [Klebsiella pneumoniae]MCS7357304.1 ead/Ea22-like family protein [Klebsiella pneumoniae]MCS7362888.1 ead/Ea22-like family protein [Klebsiella pneumoniae]
MTTDITELAQRMKAAAGKATQGEWWADEVKKEGCYGSGDDCVEGFTSYAIYGSDGQTLFDSLNSDAACICEEYDGEGHVAWDETAQSNAEFIALANPNNVIALVEELEKAQAGEKQWREVVDAFCADDADWHKLTNSNNELIALLSQALCKQADRIAELESRTVTVKLPEVERSIDGTGYAKAAGAQYYKECVIKALTAQGIKVEAE